MSLPSETWPSQHQSDIHRWSVSRHVKEGRGRRAVACKQVVRHAIEPSIHSAGGDRVRNGPRTVDERDDNNLVAGAKRHHLVLLWRWKSIGCHHRRSGLRSLSWRVPILGSKSEFDLLISRGLQAKIQLIDHATRLNDALTLFVAVEGKLVIHGSTWIRVYFQRKKAELKRRHVYVF